MPIGANGTAAGQAEASKPGCCQPAAALSDDFHAASMGTTIGSPSSSSTTSLPASPAGDGDPLVTAIASVLGPATSRLVTSMICGLFQPAPCPAGCPATKNSNWSSAAMSIRPRTTLRPAGIVTAPRKNRVPWATDSCGLAAPSGCHTHEHPAKSSAGPEASTTSDPSWPIQRAVNSSGFKRPMLHRAGSL